MRRRSGRVDRGLVATAVATDVLLLHLLDQRLREVGLEGDLLQHHLPVGREREPHQIGQLRLDRASDLAGVRHQVVVGGDRPTNTSPA